MQLTKVIVRSGIRTHAHRSGLRPERSALDRSAILTLLKVEGKVCRDHLGNPLRVLNIRHVHVSGLTKAECQLVLWCNG